LGGQSWIPKLYNGKNKNLFYFAYQGFRYTQDSDTLLKVPTAAQLRAMRAVSDAESITPFFPLDPISRTPENSFCDPFPGNQIPTN